LKRRSDLYLKDILEAISRIEEYLSNMDFEEFIENKLTADAVLRNLEIVGEAATQLQKEVKDKNPQVPWRNIQDFRIIAAHKYWGVNKETIWGIIKTKLEPLKQQIEEIVAEINLK